MFFLYFDPGLGAMIAQAAVAAAAAAVLFSKTVLYKVKSFFGLQKEESSDPYDSIDIEDKDTDNDSKPDRK